MPILAAVDPGLSGAITAIRYGEGIELLSVIDIPTMADNSKRQVNTDKVCQWVERFRPDYAVMENVQPMGGKGADSVPIGTVAAFRFGMAIGQVRAVLQCYRIPLALVVPRVWKQHFGLSGSDKELSRQAALRLLPAAAPFLQRKADHNRADSILIALYQAERRGFL